MKKTAVIISNTGTPNGTSVPAVRKYLKEFLGDGRVITMPTLLRKLLVNGIIVPFRAPKSAKLYEKVWTAVGSPLLVHSQKLQNKLQAKLGDEFEVMLGMRYGNPSLKSALQKVCRNDIKKVILLPMFPQYASSTTGTIKELACRELSCWNNIPALKTIGQFYHETGFIECFAENISKKDPQKYDHVIFSYHGLPLRHVKATHHGHDCSHFNCATEVNEHNAYCYRATCYATTRLLVEKLDLQPEKYTVCFQSRFSRNWLSPFADEVIKKKAKQGVKKMLVVSPSFVTDCLETIVEIGVEYKDLFLKNGGETFDWVHSLNNNDNWAEFLAELIVKE
jgi:protoporphyrin/coproporphyrin ferrochelatase